MQTDPASLPSAAELSDDEKETFSTQLSGDIYLLNNVPKYVLLRLESELTDNVAVWDNRVISIEHVLPQNPPASSEWIKDFDSDDREQLVHQLGNLVLLSKNKNSAAKAYEFDKKKTAYFEKSGGASFAWTNGVISKDKWEPELIRIRTVEAVDHLKKLWSL